MSKWNGMWLMMIKTIMKVNQPEKNHKWFNGSFSRLVLFSLCFSLLLIENWKRLQSTSSIAIKTVFILLLLLLFLPHSVQSKFCWFVSCVSWISFIIARRLNTCHELCDTHTHTAQNVVDRIAHSAYYHPVSIYVGPHYRLILISCHYFIFVYIISWCQQFHSMIWFLWIVFNLQHTSWCVLTLLADVYRMNNT